MTSTIADAPGSTSPGTDGADAVGPTTDSASVMIDGEINIVVREKRTNTNSEIYYTRARTKSQWRQISLT